MTRRILVTLITAAALSMGCGDKDTGSTGDDSGSTADDSGDTNGADDSGTTDECNTANEDCGPGTCSGEGSNMLPGSNCQSCHTQGLMPEDDEPDKWFSVAGTVFSDLAGSDGVSGVTVRVTDSEGTTVELTSSSAGNFKTTKALVPPLNAEVEYNGSTATMASEVSTGACNSCHNCDGPAGGKLHP